MSHLRNKSEYWNETFHLALQALWSNKLRAGLTILGVIIGSGCIVLVVTVALLSATCLPFMTYLLVMGFFLAFG